MSHSELIETQFDKLQYVPLPTPEERGAILKALARCKSNLIFGNNIHAKMR